MQRPLGELLVDMGYVNERELEAALDVQRRRSGTPRLGEILVEHGVCDEEQVAKAVAVQAGLKYCQISKFRIPRSVVAKVPQAVAEAMRVFPLKVGKRALIVASDAPPAAHHVEDLRFLLGTEIEVVIASTVELQAAIDEYYGQPPALSRDDLTVVLGSGLFCRALSRLTGEIELLLRDDGVRLSGEQGGARVQHELGLAPHLQERLLSELHLGPGVLTAARATWQPVSLLEGDRPIHLRVRAFSSPNGRSLSIQRA